MPTPELKIKLILQTVEFSEEMQEAENAVESLGDACAESAEKVDDVAAELTEAQEAATEATEEFAGSISKAKGGLDVFEGATAIASGSIGGMAQGALKAAQGLRDLGVSMAQARLALLSIGAAVAVITLVVQLIKEMQEAAAQLDQIKMDNLINSARAVGEEFGRASEKIKRAQELADGLKGVDDEVEEARHRIALYDLDARRDRELAETRASGGDEKAVTARYAAERAALESGWEREKESARVEGLNVQMSRSQERRAAIEAQMNDLQNYYRKLNGQANDYYQRASSTMWRERGERLMGLGDQASQAAKEVAQQILGLGAEMNALKDSEKILAARLEAAGLGTEELDAKARAEAAADALAAVAAPEKEEEEKDAGAGIAERVGTLSDRLARIGGYTGNGFSAANEARAQLNETKKGNQILANIERKIGSPFSGGVAVLA